MDKNINEILQHHGVKGMRWGVRRYRPKSSGIKSALSKLKKKKASSKPEKTPKKKEVNEDASLNTGKPVSSAAPASLNSNRKTT